MIARSTEHIPVKFSVFTYKLLLLAYPSRFRGEYGPHMLQVFRDCCVYVFRQDGLTGMARLWMITLPDFVRSLIKEHVQKETDMSKSQFTKIGGWILILGGLASAYGMVAINMGLNSYYRLGLPMGLRHYSWEILRVGFLFSAIGMLGLRARYGDGVGYPGKQALLIAGIAGIAVVIVPTFIEISSIEEYGIVAILVMYTGLLVFGGIALRLKPLPRWNWLPLLAGIWWPAYWTTYYMTDGFFGYRSEPLITSLIVVGSIMAASTVLLGFFLQADMLEETPATA